jgi:hypothetical protein
LQNDAHLLADAGNVQRRDVLSIERDGAGLGLLKAEQQRACFAFLSPSLSQG